MLFGFFFSECRNASKSCFFGSGALALVVKSHQTDRLEPVRSEKAWHIAHWWCLGRLKGAFGSLLESWVDPKGMVVTFIFLMFEARSSLWRQTPFDLCYYTKQKKLVIEIKEKQITYVGWAFPMDWQITTTLMFVGEKHALEVLLSKSSALALWSPRISTTRRGAMPWLRSPRNKWSRTFRSREVEQRLGGMRWGWDEDGWWSGGRFGLILKYDGFWGSFVKVLVELEDEGVMLGDEGVMGQDLLLHGSGSTIPGTRYLKNPTLVKGKID